MVDEHALPLWVDICVIHAIIGSLGGGRCTSNHRPHLCTIFRVDECMTNGGITMTPI